MTTNQWNEAEHPRDKEGKFTYKNGGNNSNSSPISYDKEKFEEIANNFYPTMLKSGVVKNEYKKSPSFNEIQNHIAVNYMHYPVLRQIAHLYKGKEATENYVMARAQDYLDTGYAKDNTIFNNYKELEPNLRKYFKDKITSQIGSEYLETTKGIYFDNESEASKRVAKVLGENTNFKKIFDENKDAIICGAYINSSLNFYDKNFGLAIGNADIRDMHIDRQGNLDLLITDVYDFNESDSSKLVQLAREKQLKGELIPYFNIYHVTITKKQRKKYNL